MYIPEFFCGILFTILAEIVICIGAAILLRKEDRKKEEPAQARRKGEDDANN